MPLLQELIALLYPPRCILCKNILTDEDDCEEGYGLCQGCWHKIPWLNSSCRRCAMPYNNEENVCFWCKGKKFAFQQAFALAHYEGEWRGLLHRFKYGGKRHLSSPLGKMLAEKVAGQLSTSAIVVPVPLYKKREKERGFNQSLLLAQSVSKNLSLPCQDILVRRKDTATQTGLNRKERRINVEGAFTLKETFSQPINGKVLLVDDIMTTCATVDEAARVLKKAGAETIIVVTAAR